MYEDCRRVQKNFTTSCDWLCRWLWTLPTVADQWYWSFNSANVATVEVFHVRLNESVTLRPSTHHTHRAFPVPLSFCLIHMLEMFNDSYHTQRCYQTILFQSACSWFDITRKIICFSSSYLFFESIFFFFLSLPWLCVWVCIRDVGMTKVEEKLKAGRVKRPEGSGFSEEPQRRPTGTPSHHSKKDPATTSSGECLDQLVNWDYFTSVHHCTLALAYTSIKLNCKTRKQEY